jgi:hypothetical protein
MYFEDAIGAKDTLVFGYDPTATDSIDLSFQEINIISQSWSNQFEARIIVLNSPSAFGFEEYANVPEVGHLKKQIKKEDCLDQSLYISMIQLKNVVYPVSVMWDNTLFIDQCRSNSIITDWHPAGWFDAVIGNNPQLPFELNYVDSASFTHTSIHNINSNEDTLDVLFFALGNENQVFVGLDEHKKMGLNIYPNPSNDHLNIETNGNQNIKSIALLDIDGKQIYIKMISNKFDIKELSSGIYFIKVHFESGEKETFKVIKE